jgi:cobaltochelatase CobN
MHLLTTTQVMPGVGETAVDLGQTPGEVVILSAADSELSSLALAHAAQDGDAPSLRLANLLRLGHPLSVDLYAERVVAQARLVIVRLLGGRAYWSYGVERLSEIARDIGLKLLFLPGDDQLDPDLATWSTLDGMPAERLWRYLVEGGPENSCNLIRYAASLLGRATSWEEPRPVPRAGLYRPGVSALRMDDALIGYDPARPQVLVPFYRALFQSGDLAPIDALIDALDELGMQAWGAHVSSLKDPVARDLLSHLVSGLRPAVILNATGFAVGEADPLAPADCPVLQVVLSGGSKAAWRGGMQGLSPRDLAMQVALPELDGRILSRAISFKASRTRDPRTEMELVRHEPVPDRVAWTANLAAAWAALRRTEVEHRKVAIVMANYPIRDGRIANGVGLDTPASCVALLQALRNSGYRVGPIPVDGDGLIRELQAGVTNDLGATAQRMVRANLPLTVYRRVFERLPPAPRDRILQRWGVPEADPHVREGAFPLAILPLSHVVVGLQPSRGWDVDPADSWHSPDLPPPHSYLAFYIWLREVWAADAMVQLGKHGNVEWLPGKALALADDCFPEAVLGPLPLIYPFIVNDPGEGTQAKRRSAAVIVDHLTPPLTRAESHGEQRALEQLVDEYWEAAGLDPRRVPVLEEEILERAHRAGLDRDLDLEQLDSPAAILTRLDAHLCELKELQIRDGLHVLGSSPKGEQRTDLLVALARAPRGGGTGRGMSLHRALAADLGLGCDPLAGDMGAPWHGPRPADLMTMSNEPWRTVGDTIERIEALARKLVAGDLRPGSGWQHTAVVLDEIASGIAPSLDLSGAREMEAVLAGLGGRRVEPGPSGAPTRGRPEVLPTGRNFYSVDTRAVPTPAAWRLGWQSACKLMEHHLQLHGDWPKRVALSAWGTANMRTGGDDVAQALALLGCRPCWDPASGRVTGVEILSLSTLDRPRVDVTLRISGLFRDSFPAQVALIDDAVRAVAALEEPDDLNPLAAATRADRSNLEEDGLAPADAERLATARIFGALPGAYGTGLQGLVDGQAWSEEAELGRAFIRYGGHAYGRGLEGRAAPMLFRQRLGAVQLVLHNQDNREHDLLDSDDYWQFEGGLAAAVRAAGGPQPEILHIDTSRPERPRVARLKEEIGRIVRGRATNPKWLRGVMRHGYKGAFEIAATVDYLFAFASTSRVVGDHHFDALFEAYIADEEVRTFIRTHNPAALREIAARFAEAIRRELWRPQRNSVGPLLETLLASCREPDRERPAPEVEAGTGT